LSFSVFTDFENFSTFAPADIHKTFAAVMFDQLEMWARALEEVRSNRTLSV
jgi:hypothetical protein